EVHARLAKMHRQQLRVAVRHVQQRHVAETRQLVHRFAGRGGVCIGPASQSHPGDGAGPQHLEEIALRQAHLLTGELGSSSKAITSRIWASVRLPMWPARGMLEQAL